MAKQLTIRIGIEDADDIDETVKLIEAFIDANRDVIKAITGLTEQFRLHMPAETMISEDEDEDEGAA